METTRQCAECGKPFEPGRTWSLFCAKPAPCKDNFHRLMQKRGKVLTPLRLVAHGGKHVASDVARYARREADALEARWNAEDRACGRNVVAGVMEKMARGWKACDL